MKMDHPFFIILIVQIRQKKVLILACYNQGNIHAVVHNEFLLFRTQKRYEFKRIFRLTRVYTRDSGPRREGVVGDIVMLVTSDQRFLSGDCSITWISTFMVSVLLNEFVIGVILLSECIELVID